MRTGHWKDAGFDQMIVRTHESRSNTFWNDVSTVENVPRRSPCTSLTNVSSEKPPVDAAGTYVLHDVLRRQVISPEPDSTERHGAGETSSWHDVGRRCAVSIVIEEPRESTREPCHLPRERPEACAHDADALHQTGSDPRCAEFKNGRNAPDQADLPKGNMGRKQVREHLPREGQHRKVEQRECERWNDRGMTKVGAQRR